MCTTLTPFAVPHPKWLPMSSSSTRPSPTRAPIKINAGNICDFAGKEVCVFHCISFGEAHCEVGGQLGVVEGHFCSRRGAKFSISWKPPTIHGSLADLFESSRKLKLLAYFWPRIKDLYIFITNMLKFVKLSQKGQRPASLPFPFHRQLI